MESASVYDQIRRRIVGNDLRPGAKINVDALVRELGVSQTPVREALSQLEGVGLVERINGRGYSTTALLDETEFRHMFEVRMLLEPWSASVLAVDRMTNPGAELVDLVDAFRAAGHISRTELAAHDELFHRTLHRATGNAFLFTAFDSLHAQLHLFRLYADDIEAGSTMERHVEVTLDEHRTIALAVAECRATDAEAAMRRHLQNSLRRFVPQLADRQGGDADPVTVPTGRVLGGTRPGSP